MRNLELSRYGRAFIAGSAYPVVFFPFALLSLSSWAKPDSGFSMESVVWFFPWAMGFWNVLFVKLRSRIPLSEKGRYWVWGILLGVIFPTIGNLSGAPAKLWGLPFPFGLLVIPLGVSAYALVWRYGVRAMNIIVGIDEEK